MTDVQFEFINSNIDCKTKDVKEELIVEYETYDINYQNKCGEIYAAYSGNFILICGFCQNKFEDMFSFGTHISATHPDNMKAINKLLGSNFEASHDGVSKIKDDADNGAQIFLTQDAKESTILESDEDSIQNDYNISTEDLIPNESDSYSCNICDQSFEVLAELNNHCQEHIDIVDDAQTTPVNNIRRAKKPRRRKAESNYSDDQDDLPLTEIRDSLKDAKAVAASTASTISIPCDKCNRLFKTNRALSYHIARLHNKTETSKPDPDDPQYYRCKYCNQEFPSRPECQEHEQHHNEEKPYLCWHCNLGFKTSSGRKRHVRIHTGERPFQCEECPRSFDNKDQLESHVHKHKNPRKFTCQTCGESFFRRFQLGLHEQRRHTGDRPLVCEDCGKRFVTMGELTQHRIRHSDVKDWKCEVCGKCFYSKWALKDHMAGHSDAKPFGCEVCGRWFSRPKALKKHKKLHSDVKAYVCNICGKAYAQDSGLYAHKKTHGIKSSK